jgi:cytochrome c
MLKTILTAAAALAIATGAAKASGDAANGEKVFKKCAACHMIGDGAKNRVGPILTGIVGRAIASVDDFKYSDAFLTKKSEGFVWSNENLHDYLENPRKYIPKNKMSFAGLKKEDERDDVIAYLETFGQ